MNPRLNDTPQCVSHAAWHRLLLNACLLAWFALAGGTARAEAGFLDMGADHSCALTPAGGVKCWGRNFAGQVGDGTQIDRSTPVDVVGLQSGVTSVSTGIYHSCALLTNGSVKCWGLNTSGRLGDGTFSTRLVPTSVVGLPGAVAEIDAGGGHNCVVTATGAAYCWGSNAFLQIGDGTAVSSRPTPTAVSGLGSGVLHITAGNDQSCAVTTTGATLCWGKNVSGELGDGTNTNRNVPTPVVGLGSGSVEVSSGGEQSCGLDTVGAVRCWGNGGAGKLGNGAFANSNVPVAVSGLSSGVSSIAMGFTQSCALLVGGGQRCWGENFAGGIGDGTRTSRNVPTAALGLDPDLRAIAGGFLHTCALTFAGQVRCWGENLAGQIGNGVLSYPPSLPVQLAATPVVIAGGSGGHMCAVTAAGGASCWGANGSGGLGNGGFVAQATPVVPSGLGSGVATTAKAIGAGGGHSCAISTTGALQCWGRNNAGQLGDLTNFTRTAPVAVDGLGSGVSRVALGFEHTCAIVSGGVKCWGLGSSGQLGNNAFAPSTSPVNVQGIASGATDVAAGFTHSCAVVSGAVSCWGNNASGQLGTGVAGGTFSTPQAVPSLASGVTQVVVGNFHSCALTSTGGVLCWGANGNGYIGDGTFSPRLTPTAPIGLGSGVAEIVASRETTCARLATGSVRCWGDNARGQIGDGSNVARNTPVAVPGISGATGVSIAELFSCAATASGQTYCWGNNFDGSQGAGVFGYYTQPQAVSGDFFSPTVGTVYAQIPPLPPLPPTSRGGGKRVRVAKGTIVVGAPLATIDGAESGEVYVYTGGSLDTGAGAATPADSKLGWGAKALAEANLATLQLPIPLNGDKFGAGGLAINPSGTTIVVGAPGQDGGRGAVYVFKRPVDGWASTNAPTQTFSGATSGDEYGAALAMTNAGTVIVGAPGSTNDAGKAYVLRPDANGNLQAAETLDAFEGGKDYEQAGARFGAAITGEGSELFIGAPEQDVGPAQDAGAVVVFREPNQGQSYSLRELITRIDPALADKFGWSLDLDDGTLAVGEPGHDEDGAPDAGAVRIYDEDPSGTMEETASITDPTPDAGAELGTSVDVEDQTVAAGAPYDDVNGNEDQGSVQVYTPSTPDGTISGNLDPTGTVTNPDGAAGDEYGSDLSLNKELAAIGAPNGDGRTSAKRRLGIKALAETATGEALAYAQNRLFRDGLESPRGALDGCDTPNLSIPDANAIGLVRELTLAGSGSASNVEVEVELTHGFVSHLNLALTHVPSGRTVPLYAAAVPASSCASNDMEVRFSDHAPEGFASSTCNDTDPAVDGARIPKDWLIQFQGVSRAGPWRLTAKDQTAGETGTLALWCVSVR